MLRTLLESGAAPTRRAGGTVISIAVHTGAIALAIVATARATVVKVDDGNPPIDLVYKVPTQVQPSTNRSRGKSLPGTYIVPPVRRYVVPPLTVPTGLPPIDAMHNGTDPVPIDFGAAGHIGRGVVDGAGLGSPDGGVYTARVVEKAAAPRPGNPAPVYPSALRAAQLEGTVLARFVVDTAGRAEPRSIEFPETTHAQFAEAVRQSLLRSRYLPAMLDGHPVRQLVEQRFAFTLSR